MSHIIILVLCLVVGVFAHQHKSGQSIEAIAEEVAENEVDVIFHLPCGSTKEAVEILEKEMEK